MQILKMGRYSQQEIIYFDGLSSSKPLDSVLSAIQQSLVSNWGNPLSRHSSGRKLNKIIENTRSQLLEWLGCEASHQAVFCSSGTEAINLGIRGAQNVIDGITQRNEILTTRIEHPAVLESLKSLEQHGFKLRYIDVDSQGRIDLSNLTNKLSNKTAFVCLQAVNQDIGMIQPIKEVGETLQQWGIPFFVDACFGVGWTEISDWLHLVDAMALSFHRFYGPTNIGALVLKPEFRMNPILFGGRQENDLRPGIENVHAITGLSTWINEVAQNQHQWLLEIAEKQRLFHKSLVDRLNWIYLNGPEPGRCRSAGNLHFSAAGIEGQGLVLRGDLKGIALGSGSACLGRGENSEAVIKSLGATKHRVLGSFQACPGLFTTPQELEKATLLMSDCIHFLRQLSPDWEYLEKNPNEIEILMDFRFT